MIVKLQSYENRKSRQAADSTRGKAAKSRKAMAAAAALAQYIVHPDPTGQIAANLARYIAEDLVFIPEVVRVRHAYARNFIATKPDAQVYEMQALAAPHTEKIIEHIILSFQTDENPTDNEAEDAADNVMHILKLSQCPFFVAIHGDTDNTHIHIVVCRVDSGGKAITIGNGRALESAQMAAAFAEYKGGWRREPNEHFVADRNGIHDYVSGTTIADLSGNTNNRIAQRVRDGRNHLRTAPDDVELSDAEQKAERETGQWSTNRIAQVIAANRIRLAKNWRDVHESLACVGIGYEPVAGGAVLSIGENTIAASKAYPGAALGKLSNRLGPYSECPDDIERRQFVAPTFAARKDDEEKKAEKAKLQAEKEQHGRKSALATAIIKAQYEAALRQLNQQNWAGKRDHLNAARKKLAEKRNAELAQLKLVIFDVKPLKTETSKKKKDHWVGAIHQGSATDVKHTNPAATAKLSREYELAKREGWTSYYFQGHFQFRETANLISLAKGLDDAGKRDALVLAASKWSTVEVFGSAKTRTEMAKLAGEMNVKLSDPSLQKIADAHRQKLEAAEISKSQTPAKPPSSIPSPTGGTSKRAADTSTTVRKAQNMTTSSNSPLWHKQHPDLAKWCMARAAGATDEVLDKLADACFPNTEDDQVAMTRLLTGNEFNKLVHGNNKWKKPFGSMMAPPDHIKDTTKWLNDMNRRKAMQNRGR